MPKKGKRTSSANSGGAMRPVFISGHSRALFSVTGGNIVDTLALDCSISSALATAADMWGLYRFTKLTIELIPGIRFSAAPTVAPQCFGVFFTPEALLTNPSTFAECCQMPFVLVNHTGLTLAAGTNSYTSGGTTYPRKLSIPRGALMTTGVKWFRTLGKGTETDWETQGTIVTAIDASTVAGNVAINCILSWTVEFSDPLPTSVTRERLVDQLRQEMVTCPDPQDCPVHFQPPPKEVVVLPPDKSFYYRGLNRRGAV